MSQQRISPGAQGPAGLPGLPGPANTLTVGTITKIAAGGTPTVSITGTSPNQTLNLGLVTGDSGASGLTAVTAMRSGAAYTSSGSTSLVQDTAFNLALSVGTWHAELDFAHAVGNGISLAFSFTGTISTGVTRAVMQGPVGNGSGAYAPGTWNTTVATPGYSGGTTFVRVSSYLVVTAPGTLQLSYGQTTAGATGTIAAGNWIKALRLA